MFLIFIVMLLMCIIRSICNKCREGHDLIPFTPDAESKSIYTSNMDAYGLWRWNVSIHRRRKGGGGGAGGA